MTETLEQRRRRKFVAGALDQAATLLRGSAVGVLTAGSVAPLVALLGGALEFPALLLAGLVGAAMVISGLLGVTAVWLKGRAKVREDDALAPLPTPRRRLKSFGPEQEPPNA